VKAVRFDKYGGTDVLYLAEVDRPTPGPGEVVVKVRAAAINPGESSIREGFLDEMFPTTFPSGEGSDLAGVITEVGEQVPGFAVEDEVLGWTDERASHADYVVVPITQLIGKPDGMPWTDAGSMYVIGVTAFAAVRAVDVKAGDTVVVSAAAGGVGSFVVQLLRIKEANVIGIASDANHEWLSAHGVTPVAYGDDLANRLQAAAPEGIDAFIDLFGPDYVRLAVSLGVPPKRINTIIAWQAAEELGTKAEGSSTASTTDVLAEMTELVASGQVEIPLAATYPLDLVREAFTELDKRHTRGKIVLIPG
jgi:NADPH2:quinone reductase